MGIFEEKIKRMELSLSFGDILIKPAESSIVPADVDLSLKLGEELVLSVPLFAAAMDTVTSYEMARALIAGGCCAPLHKNFSVQENIENISKLFLEFGSSKPIAVSVGVSNTEEDIKKFVEAGANVIVVDSAHGHSKNVGDLVSLISKNYPNIFLIAGNVVTKEGAKFLVEKGAKAVKVGIGLGSICTTSKVTGIGRGQISAISEVADFNKGLGIITIADGGMRSTDEIMKAIVCGADAVMLGFMFAGCDECPGEIVEIDGEKYKKYRGMGSLGAMSSGSASRYNKHGVDSCKWVPEGVESYLKYKGPVKDVITSIEWSLRSAFGYVGAKNIEIAQRNSELVRGTREVVAKSNVHSVIV